MNAGAMRQRCPNSRALGRARLARHRIFVMSSGHFSVKRDPWADVHGVLYDVALCDVPALDRYEEVGRGLYAKIAQPVLREGVAPVRALLYVGRDQKAGVARPDYIADVLAAARDWNLPGAYIASLMSCAGMKPGAGREAASRRTSVKTDNQ